MPIKNLFKVSQADRYNFCSRLIDTSAPNENFYFLVILSTLIVSLGILADNTILVIGGMVVTPLLSPILAIALGIVINDAKTIMRSVKVFLTAFGFIFFIAFFLGVFSSVNIADINLITIMKPSLFIFFVALVAGLAASFTWTKPGLDSTLPGIAITVTLIPPLTAVGLAVSHREWTIVENVIEVLFLNILGIIIASLVVFSLMDFYKAKKKVVEEIKNEEKIIQQEKKKAEAAK